MLKTQFICSITALKTTRHHVVFKGPPDAVDFFSMKKRRSFCLDRVLNADKL